MVAKGVAAAKRCTREIASANDGVVALMWALALPATLGFMALGVETTQWYTTKQNLQAAADSGAMAAALELAKGNIAGYIAVGIHEAKRNGLDATAVVTVGPPTSGSHIADAKAAQVIVTQTVNSLFASMFIKDIAISARSVASTVQSSEVIAGKGCILALNKTVTSAVLASGSTDLESKTCDIYVNSSNNTAFLAKGSADVKVRQILVVGNYAVQGSAKVTNTLPTVTGVTALADPYDSVVWPAVGACQYNNTVVTGSGVKPALTPGVYCGGLIIEGSTTVTMNPGVYTINGGDFDLRGSSNITGSGVTIFLTGGTAATCATSKINGSTTVTLNAPTTGDYKGIVYHYDKKCANTNPSFLGSATMKLTGVIHMPTQAVTFSGSSQVPEDRCVQLVVDTVTFTGSSEMSSTCDNTGVTPLGSSLKTQVSFVE